MRDARFRLRRINLGTRIPWCVSRIAYCVGAENLKLKAQSHSVKFKSDFCGFGLCWGWRQKVYKYMHIYLWSALIILGLRIGDFGWRIFSQLWVFAAGFFVNNGIFLT